MNNQQIANTLRLLSKEIKTIEPHYKSVRPLSETVLSLANELDPPAKPLLADAKVGDLCKRRDGKLVQVDSYSNDRPCPVMCKSDIGGQDCFTLDGRNHNAINDSKDIIATEPLAEVGTAEWALQMMKLGNKVRNRDWDGGTYEKSLLYCQLIGETIKYNEGCSAFDVCLSDWEAPYIKNTGWQLYEEPQPEPEKESPIDPIERPLRSLILRAKEEGKNIRTFYQDMVFTPCALDGLLADGEFRWWNISNWELTNREQNYYPQISNDEPNPEPFAVGGCKIEFVKQELKNLLDKI